MATLCEFCNSLDFSVLGVLSRTEAERTGLIPRTRPDKKKLLREILEDHDSCPLCRKIYQLFEASRSGQLDGEACPENLKGGTVFLVYKLLASVDRCKDGRPAYVLVSLHMQFSVRRSYPDVGYFAPSFGYLRCSPGMAYEPRYWQVTANPPILPPKEYRYCGRDRPLQANQKLFLYWKRLCDASHGNACGYRYDGDSKPRLRFIDVERRCIVDSKSDNQSYVALSYVWGLANHALLTNSTNDEYRREGALTESRLPRTIADAIEVTKCLDERYLWIDSLCIIQDDEGDKLDLIPQMHTIYGLASVTIVAASGDNADAGLAGIRLGSRDQKQDIFTVKGVTLISSLEPLRMTKAILENSTWTQRSWTFQEGLFSARTLIFTPQQVYWACQQASWCESTCLETIEPPNFHRNIFGIPPHLSLWRSNEKIFPEAYLHIAEEFSGRKLTYDGDALDACSGILNAFKRDFFWAIPVPLFSKVLRWGPYPQPGLKRRLAACKWRSRDGTIKEVQFPSWSWIGWTGRSPLATRGLLDGGTAGLVFYRLGDTGDPQQIETAPILDNKDEIGADLLTVGWKDDSRTTICRQHISAQALEPSVLPTLICFWSSSVILIVRHKVPPADTQVDELTMFKPDILHAGNRFPSEWIHVPEARPGVDEQAEFVIISRFHLDHEDSLVALMVYWDSGVAYRCGSIGIKISDWVALNNRVWKPIVLG